jgi:hypothetical protein
MFSVTQIVFGFKFIELIKNPILYIRQTKGQKIDKVV